MYWYSLLELYDHFHLVNNKQKHEMVSIFRYTNYFVSTSVEELDNYNKQFYHHFHKNQLIRNEE